MATPKLNERATEALKRADEARTGHHELVAAFERGYRAYRGVLEDRASLDWTTKSTPPYAMHIVETSISALIEDSMRFRVRPRPKFYTPDEMTAAREGARAHERLLAWQLHVNRWQEKQRAFVLQERLAGITVAKLRWRTEIKMRRKLSMGMQEVTDEMGNPLGTYPTMQETEEPDVAYDGPDIEVVDVRDFFWDMNAPSWEKNEIAVHRVWMTPEELRAMASPRLPAGVRWRNTDELSDTRDFSGEFTRREMLSESARNRGRIEVWEIWMREKGKLRVYTIANRSVLLNERDSPYWHGEFPFIVCSTQADMFKIGGVSQIEKIADLQRNLWTISNLRTDAVKLATMPIVLLQEGFDDPDSFDFRPFARNLVQSPQDVQMWAPNAQATQVSLPTEATIKADMQNLTGGFPFTSSTEARTIDANTATEASLAAGLAQRSLVTAKTFLNYGYERLGQMMMSMNQQFVRDPVWIDVLGIDDTYETQVILPMMLRGEYDFEVQPVSESLMRQERRSEASTLFQMAMQAASMFAMTGQPLNLKPFLEDVLDAFDKKDIERYLFPQQPPMGMPGGQGGPSPVGAPSLPTAGFQQGVTAPQATSQGSPSNAMSMNPAVSMQRMGAMNGGVNTP